MKTTAVYFSPTGNTKKSVEAMAGALDEKFQTVDLTVPQRKDGEEIPVQMRFSGEDFVIFGMPVYGGRLPAPAAGWLSPAMVKTTRATSRAGVVVMNM